MAQLIIDEQTLIKRYGENKTKLAKLAHRAVDWVEKHGDAHTLARAVMGLLEDDVVMYALFGEDGESRATRRTPTSTTRSMPTAEVKTGSPSKGTRGSKSAAQRA